MDENLKNLAGRSIAGDIFKQTANNMQNIHIPTMEERMQFSSAAYTISEMAGEIEKWKENTPKNSHLVVILQTPDGRSMDVHQVRPSGFQSFVAEGNIQGLPCMLAGHISTLALLCSYEEDRGKDTPGFKIVIPKAVTEPQPTPGQIPPDKA